MEESQAADKLEEDDDQELTSLLEQGELEAIGLNLEKEQTLCFSCVHVPCLRRKRWKKARQQTSWKQMMTRN